ncbi:hypothetical protein AB205_0115980, partial [Aquarana catesbeiana]
IDIYILCLEQTKYTDIHIIVKCRYVRRKIKYFSFCSLLFDRRSRKQRELSSTNTRFKFSNSILFLGSRRRAKTTGAERYQKEQEKLKEEWEKAQKEVEEEERKYYEEERKIIEDTLMPLTVSPTTSLHHGTWTEAKSCVKEAAQPEDNKPQVPLWTLEGALNRPEVQNNGSGRLETEEMVAVTYDNNCAHQQQCNTPTSLHLQFGVTLESNVAEDVASLNNFVASKSSQPRSPCVDSKGLDPPENPRDIINSSQSTSSQGQSPNRSVSGKKLCSTCGIPLGKGAAMIIETLSLYFHIQCFKCGICKGQLGDATTGTDVRIRNGLLNCNDCYIRSRTAGHPTPL